MRFSSLLFLASVAAIVQGAPKPAAKCHSVKGESGYFQVYKDGYLKPVSVNKAKHIYFNPAAKSTSFIKVRFEYCPAFGKYNENENGPIYKGRIVVTNAGSNMCLTVTGGAEPHGLTVQKCKSSTKPSGGQLWVSYGQDDYQRLYEWQMNGYRTDPNQVGSVLTDPGTNYVSIGCTGGNCEPFRIRTKY